MRIARIFGIAFITGFTGAMMPGPMLTLVLGQVPIYGMAAVWAIVGGHAVIVAGYNAGGLRVISWGSYYTMTWSFWSRYVDEAYALADPDWFRATGIDPFGMSLPELESQMSAILDCAAK